MNKKLLAILCAVALHTASAYAAESSGSIGLGVNLTSVKGQSAKFNEYQEKSTGASANFLLDIVGQNSQYLTLSGEGLGYNEDAKEQGGNADIQLKFGMYEYYKAKLYYNYIPHNFTYDARTFLSGLGTSALTGLPTPTPNTWNKFDYKVDRTNLGAATEFSFKSPYFVGIKFDHTEQKGLYPLGINANTFTEFPGAIDTTTDNFNFEAGYRSKSLIFKVDGMISEFGQGIPWQNVQGSAAPVGLAPDSDYYKVGGSLKANLPLNSTLMARGNHSIFDNYADLSLSGTPTAPRYHGRITNTTAAIALTSNPVAPLDIKVYFNLLDRQNKSTEPFLYAAQSGNPAHVRTTGNYGFSQQNIGIDVDYKLPAKTKVGVGYEYLNLNRADSNVPATATAYYGNHRLSNQDHIVYVEAKNTYLDSLTAKVRYQRLKRFGGTWTSDNMAAPAVGTENLPPNMRPYDSADKTQDSVKLALEFEPIHNLEIGIDYLYKQNDYSNTRFGITNDNRHEVSLDANYVFSIVRLNAFFDFERVESDLSQKNSTSLTISPTVFNWSALRKDINYAAGAKIDIDIIKNLLSASIGYRYENSDGTNDFTNKNATSTLQDALYVESTTRHSLTANVNYKVSTNVDVTCGYAFDKLRYNDWQMDGYQYVVPGGGYITGAYANPDYEAHVGHVALAYKF